METTNTEIKEKKVLYLRLKKQYEPKNDKEAILIDMLNQSKLIFSKVSATKLYVIGIKSFKVDLDGYIPLILLLISELI